MGRETEFAAIGDALRRPDLAGVMLVGDAGVGKSHLLDATLRHAEDHGFVTVRVTGTRALGDIPLAAFAGILPGRIAGDAGDLVQIRRILRDRAGGRPLLLGLDDAHLLDEASAALAHQLASDLTAFVVGTIRTGEVPPEAVTTLMTDGLALRLAVEPLPPADLARFAALTLGGPVTAQLADQLHARTLGNPLFARELLLGASATGAIVERGGVFDAVGALVAPATLTQFVEGRLAGLSAVHQRAVALVAIGGPLEIELLEQLVDPDVLVELEEARLLVADDQEDSLVVGFVHPVYADAGRAVVGRLTARQLLRELAEALERRPHRRPQDVLRIATWRLDGGSTAGPSLLAEATRVATTRNDFALAERLGAAWFDLVAATPDGLRAASRLAGAFVEQGRYDEALATLVDPRIDRDAATPADRLRAGVVQANIVFWAQGRLDPALAVLDRAVPPGAAAPPLVSAARAAMYAAAGMPDAALALVPPGSDAAAMPAGIAAALLSHTTAGRPAAALAALGPLGAHLPPSAGSIVAAAHAFALVEAGRLHDAREIATDGWERATRDDDRHGQVAWSISLGWVDLDEGRRAAAQQWFERSAHLARQSAAAVHGTRWALGGLLLAQALAGDVAAARGTRDRLDAMAPHEARAHAYLELHGRAWLLAAEGDRTAAVDHLVDVADDAERGGRTAPWLRVLTDIARLGRPDLALRLLDRRAADGPPSVDGELLPLLVDAVRAHGGRDHEALAAAADRLVELGFLVFGAEFATNAWGLMREAGAEARELAQLGRRAQELREALGAYATPAFVDTAPAVTLSRREREIAGLVADGRASREVADELIIGVRTVESHLARVYAKLGVRSRHELADALGRTAGPTSAAGPAVAAGVGS